MSKPSWEDAPEWAQYLAMDGNGAWYFYEEEPHEVDCAWLSFHGRVKKVIQHPVPWFDTKEQRPCE
jgi:hypothetical protein